ELDDAADGVDRREVIEVEFALGLANLRVHSLQDGDVELFLAAEVVVDERTGGMRAPGNGIHGCALEAARGEFVDRRLDDAGAVRLRGLGLAHRRRALDRDRRTRRNDGAGSFHRRTWN